MLCKLKNSLIIERQQKKHRKNDSYVGEDFCNVILKTTEF